MIEMTSDEVRRAWSEFLDCTEAGLSVTVTYRGRPRLVAHPHTTYMDYRRGVGGPQGEPARVTSAEDRAWMTARYIVVESGLARNIWRRVQTWVVAGGHAIVDRHGAATTALTPLSWVQDAADSTAVRGGPRRPPATAPSRPRGTTPHRSPRSSG